MFGMGLSEILVIAMIAVIFLGPEKLPDAMVKTAKFFRTIKNHLAEAKSAIDSELKLSELKSDALEYKKKLTEDAKETISPAAEAGREIKDLFGDLSEISKKTEQEIRKGS